MVRVCLPDGLEQKPGLLDVVDVSAVGGDHGLEVGEVALRVHHSLPRNAETFKVKICSLNIFVLYQF